MAKKTVVAEMAVTETPAEEPEVVTEETFEAWLGKQSEDVQAKYAEHTKGLTSALHSEREARKDAEKGAKKLAELEKAEAERAKAQLSETERLQAEVAEAKKAAETAKADAQRERVRSAIEAKATVLGFEDPLDAYTLLDVGRIELDAQGRPQVEVPLKELAKSKPYLVKDEKAAIRSTFNPGGAQSVTETDVERKRRLGIG